MLKKLISIFATLSLFQPVTAQTYFTTKCSQYEHPEFQINISSDAIPSDDITWFLTVLESMVAGGEKFKAGETVQVGWMLLMLAEGDKGALKVTEPDMKSIPIKFVDSLDATIKHLRAQKDSVESVLPADELAFSSLTQSLVVHINYKKSKRILLDRAQAEGHDSGWWLSDLADDKGSNDPKNFAKISLYQLGIDRPDLIKFLAFPAGTQVVIDRKVFLLKDGQELAVKANSFLDLLNKNSAAQ